MLKGSLRLYRLILRRERIMSAIWLLILTFFTVLIPVALDSMYPTAADAQFMAVSLENPAMIAMMGPLYGKDNFTTGAMNTVMSLLWMIIALAVMNIFLMARHTRSDEERGRYEVIRSLPVGRLSGLNAAMLAALTINGAMALITALSLASMGIESLTPGGSLLYGVSLGVSGLFFAGLTALFCQLCSGSRGAVGYSFMALGVFYIMRATGDISGEVLSLVSPLGLIQRTQANIENHWWPVWWMLVLTAIVTAAAYKLNSIRDIDQGFIPAKPGRRNASALLSTPFGLAFRLLRSNLIAWGAAMFLLGASYGSIMGDMEGFLEKNDLFKQLLPAAPGYPATQLFITMINAILCICCVIPACTASLKAHGEEKDGRSEGILARVVSRPRQLSGYVIIAYAASVLMPFLSALGLWSASSAVMLEPISFGAFLKSSMVYLPALWVMIGVSVLLTGLLPKLTGLLWGYLGFAFFMVYFGQLIKDMPEWVVKLSPFGHIPKLPVDEVNYAALTALTVIAAVLTTAGFVFYCRRDMRCTA